MSATTAEPFRGRYAVVTGGTQGLGEACARLLAERGAAGLVICGRNAERGGAVADDISRRGCPTRFIRADLARVEDCREVIAEADRAFGNLHVLVNCAGMTDRGTVWDTTPELWDRIFAVNARPPFLLMQGAAAIMRREGTAGAMVNIISMSSHGGQPFITAYCASKGALVTLTKNVAFSLLRHRIRVNGLNIGWTATEGEHEVQTQTGEPEDWLAAADASRPFGRLLRPDEDVAPIVTYLLADASRMVTGSVIDFDQTVHGPSGPRPAPAGAAA